MAESHPRSLVSACSQPPHFLEVLETMAGSPAVDGPLFWTPAKVGTRRAERRFDTTRQNSTLSVVFAHVHRIGGRCGTSRNMLRDRALVPLSQQHHNGLALCVLTDRSLQADDSPDNAARLAARALDRYDLEIANHFAVEEEVVFPMIERELGAYPILDELIAEHRHVERVADQLRLAPEAATLRELTGLLRAHIRHEESQLFEVVQQRLSRKVLDAMGAEVDSKAVRIPI